MAVAHQLQSQFAVHKLIRTQLIHSFSGTIFLGQLVPNLLAGQPGDLVGQLGAAGAVLRGAGVSVAAAAETPPARRPPQQKAEDVRVAARRLVAALCAVLGHGSSPLLPPLLPCPHVQLNALWYVTYKNEIRQR